MFYIPVTLKELESIVRQLSYETDFANPEQVGRLHTLLSELVCAQHRAEKPAEAK